MPEVPVTIHKIPYSVGSIHCLVHTRPFFLKALTLLLPATIVFVFHSSGRLRSMFFIQTLFPLTLCWFSRRQIHGPPVELLTNFSTYFQDFLTPILLCPRTYHRHTYLNMKQYPHSTSIVFHIVCQSHHET